MHRQVTLPGNVAPEFRLQDHEGQWVTLSDLTAKSAVLLAFYPGDFTLVCTKQLCAYQDNYGKFREFGLQIVGISPNGLESHQEFRNKYGFEFPLLSDPTKAVFKSYNVVSLFMLGGTSRAVFLISRKGSKTNQVLVHYRYVEPTTLTHRRPDELLGIIRNLKESELI